MPDPTLLAFDTSAAHCAAALLRGGRIEAVVVEDMARGQGERLMPFLEEMLRAHNLAWTDLDGLAVATGPGNFTGIRIAVSAARGLALGLGIPAVGVTLFEALSEGRTARITLPAPRGQVYAQTLTDGTAETDAVLEPGTAPAPDPQIVLPALARIAARQLSQAGPPVPFYVKPADAAPASDPPPVMLD